MKMTLGRMMLAIVKFQAIVSFLGSIGVYFCVA
jgi:hypothetical protein